MSQFAIFYNTIDLQAVANDLSGGTISGSDKTLALKFWNGGLKTWQTAPLAPANRAEGDADCRIVVINSTGTLADLRDLLNRRFAATGNTYLAKLARDMERSSGAVEPWP